MEGAIPEGISEGVWLERNALESLLEELAARGFQSDLFRSLVQAYARGASPAALARGFHLELARRLAAAVRGAAHATRLRDVVLSGGCLQNRLLAGELAARLTRADLRVLAHRRLPPNDGALAVGQALLARHMRGRP